MSGVPDRTSNGHSNATAAGLAGRASIAVDYRRAGGHSPGPGSPPLFYWDGKVTFTDAALRTGIEWTDVTGVVACQGRYRGHALERVLGHIALDRSRIMHQPLNNLHAQVIVDEKSPNVIQVENITAGLFGGQLGGQARVTFGSGLQYGLYLAVVGAQLEEFARQNRMGNAHLSGAARAELYLTGAGAGLDELEGAATVHVPNGKIYNLPVFLDLLKVIGFHSPDGTAFEEGHLEVAIHGRKLDVQRLDLLGNSRSASAAEANSTSTALISSSTSTPSGVTSCRCCRWACARSPHG